MEELSGGHRHGPVGGVDQVVHVLAVLIGQSVFTPPGRSDTRLTFNVHRYELNLRTELFIVYICRKLFFEFPSLIRIQEIISLILFLYFVFYAEL